MAENHISSVSSFYANASTVSFQISVGVGGASNSDTLTIQDSITETTILTLNVGSWSGTGQKEKTITLTSAQRTTLLNAIGNVARYYAKYVYTSSYNGNVVGTSYTYGYIYLSTAEDPVINSVTWEDTNASSVAVTGDSRVMIFDRSNLVFTISATATTGNTISSYTVTQDGGYTLTRDTGTIDTGVFRGLGSSGVVRWTITVADNHGHYKLQDVYVSYYTYSTRPVLTTYSIKRNTSDSTKVDISFTGKYANIGTNTVTAKYKYKVAGSGSYSAETSLTLTVSDGTFSCSTTTGSILAEDSTYEFVLILADKLETNNIYLTIPSVVPLVTFRPEAVGIGGEPTHTEALDVADGYSLNANGIQNTAKVMPYSFRTNGGSATAGWARIARIIFVSPPSGSDIKPVIEFTIQRYALGTTHMKLMFSGTNIVSDTIEPTANNASGFPQITSNSNTSFSERVSTDPYTYDIYFPKANANDVLTVYTYCDASFQDMIKIEYADNLVTTVPPNEQTGIRYFRLAPLQVVPVASRMGLGWNGVDAVNNYTPAPHTLTLAPDWSIVDHGNIQVDGKNNQFNYMPYSFGFETDSATATAGQNYYRIATINVVGETEDEAIEFYVSRRFDAKPVKLAFRFASTVSTDPTTAYLYYEDLNGTSGGASAFEAFAYRTGTSVWDIYVHKAATSDRIAVRTFVPPWMQEQVSVTYAYNKLDTIPSGATLAIPTYYQLGHNNAKTLIFNIAAGSSVTIKGSSECAWLLGCTGWNSTMRRGLWWISGYSDSSRADVIYMLGNYTNSQISITAVSGQLAWTISNTGNTTALMSCLALYGALPTIT